MNNQEYYKSISIWKKKNKGTKTILDYKELKKEFIAKQKQLDKERRNKGRV